MTKGRSPPHRTPASLEWWQVELSKCDLLLARPQNLQALDCVSYLEELWAFMLCGSKHHSISETRKPHLPLLLPLPKVTLWLGEPVLSE